MNAPWPRCAAGGATLSARDPSVPAATRFISDFIAGYVRASGRGDGPPVGLWPSDAPWLAEVGHHLAPEARPLLAGDVDGDLDLVVGVPPWRWHPRLHELADASVPLAAPLAVCDDPANVDIVRACRRLAPDGVGLFVVAPGFALRPGPQTAFPTLARLGVHAEAVIELPRRTFRPDSGSGRWLMAFSRRPPAGPVSGALTTDPCTVAQLLAAARALSPHTRSSAKPLPQPRSSMPSRPSRDDLTRYASGLHFSVDGDLDDLEPLVEAILVCAEAVEAEPEPVFELQEIRYPRTEAGRRADPAENPYNAWISRCLVEGAPEGPLSGKTVGLKDNVALAGVEMTCGTKVLEGYVPQFDATIVHRLLDAGATIVGKLNMESFAFSGSSDTSDFGEVPTPLNPDHLAGGSSSGSGAAPAAGDCDIAIGGDQGGSIRVPSAWCGLVGIKPTSGLVPYTGVFAIDMSIDHTGPQALTVTDAATTLQVIAGEDIQNGVKMDPRQPAGVRAGDYIGTLDRGVEGLKIGWLTEGIGWDMSDAAVDDAFHASMEVLAGLGAEVSEVSVPQHRFALDLWSTLGVVGAMDLLLLEAVGTNYDGWYNTDLLPEFARLRRERAQLYPPTVKSAVLAAAHLREEHGGLHYAKAQNLALGLRAAYDRVLADVDIIAMPTTPMLPYRREPDMPVVDRVGRTLTMLANTANFDMTAHPALTVPCKLTDDNLPVGLMLVGRHFEEETVLRAAYGFEQDADWKTR